VQSIIYIHGFGSSGFGVKAKLFRDYFKQKSVRFFAPSLSYVPYLAVETLKELAQNCPKPLFIGSSLGGFYALYLAKLYGTKAVLINPALYAPTTLKRHISGYANNYYDLSKFEWNDQHLKMLEEYITTDVDEKSIMLLLQTGDDVIDYKESLELLPNAKRIVEEGGTHGFEAIERHFETIERFLLS
jgi:predicted esterase YcpF (UPF0227 family)